MKDYGGEEEVEVHLMTPGQGTRGRDCLIGGG